MGLWSWKTLKKNYWTNEILKAVGFAKKKSLLGGSDRKNTKLVTSVFIVFVIVIVNKHNCNPRFKKP